MKTGKYLVSILIITCMNLSAAAQNLIKVIKVATDSIVLYNMAPYSIKLEYNNMAPVYIYKNEGIRLRFRLSMAHVRNTTFKVSYDEQCYLMDEAICSGIHKPCLGCDLILFLNAENGNDWAKWGPLLGCSLEQLAAKNDPNDAKTRWETIEEEMNSNHSIGEKKLVYYAVCLECCKEKEMLLQLNCSNEAMNYRNNPPVAVYYRAQDLIKLQQNFAFDFYPYYLTAFKQPKLANLGFTNKKYFGFRTSLNFNLYRKKRKIEGTQITVPFDFQQTPVVYSKNSNTSLPDTGYSWKNYSLGIGYRMFTYQNYYKNFLKDFALLVDIGVSKNIRTRFVIDSLKKAVKIADNISNSPLGGYINIGFQLSLFRGIGIYGSYYSNIVFSKNKPVLEVPKIHYLNIGLYINLFTKYSYQY